MKKETTNKTKKGALQVDPKKKRSYISDMMRRDREACIEKDRELVAAGIKKPKKDIIRDDSCYGCAFAIDNKDVTGPFDRRFKCSGFPRAINELTSAVKILKDASTGKKEVICRNGEVIKVPLTSKETDYRFLSAQQGILLAASLIGERLANGYLECVQTSGKPSCFVGPELEEYLKAK